MSKVNVLFAAVSASVVTAAIVASPALAWHPKGVIVKYVQNVTTGTAQSDANDAAHAVAAKPGDILKYTIEVRNDGAADERGWNDMAKTTMTDTLPAGVELVSAAATRTITADLGTVQAGKKVVREYTVKVTASKDGIITNKACFTGETTNNETQNAQQGCDTAVVNVTVPQTPVTPQPETPATPVTPVPTAPQALPNTDSGLVAGALAGVSTMGAAGYHYLRSKRNLRSAHNR
jgi:uncharacterized repeat protein (TIGR01451 family)/LPXTG-motif cell wall-anchored protein